MKHIIILGDGMADYPVDVLGGKTPLQYANIPYMDRLAALGRTGKLVTVPDGFLPGSEVANTAILGYNLEEVYEGRGPLEAASIGYEMAPDDLVLRCNIITIGADQTIVTHNGGNLQTDDAKKLMDFLNKELAAPINRECGCERVRFITGIQYRHLLVIKGGSKHILCSPPHDHPGEKWQPLLAKEDTAAGVHADSTALSPLQTAQLINRLIVESQELLSSHPFNKARLEAGQRPANSIWPWSGGYRPHMPKLQTLYPQLKSGSVISAVDLIRGIGHYAGLNIIEVEGATGLSDTNYEGKAEAAINALRNEDFVFLHVEASDEAGHDGDLQLKIKTIENLDSRIVGPVFEETSTWNEPVCIAVLPDHLTPVELRVHVGEPVPFLIYYKGITPDSVESYDEFSCSQGSYGLIRLSQFMAEFMAIE